MIPALLKPRLFLHGDNIFGDEVSTPPPSFTMTHSLLAILNISHTRFAALPKEVLQSQADLSLWQPSPLDQFASFPSPPIELEPRNSKHPLIPQPKQLALPEVGFVANTASPSQLAPPPSALSQPCKQINNSPSQTTVIPRSRSSASYSPSPSTKPYKRIPTPRWCKRRLKELLAENLHPSKERVREIAMELGMDVGKVRIWFQNQRAQKKLSEARA
ncbi:hypothetical protein BCR33DRAFT_596915 [Rhizoclosmatium globosum]|uniref:Homeobox domain-containing protein n=1 Tax=Rhizoclosmatium globosum TaxID=329046 RepID=A0A1Y2B2V5_9FUNG|nr:hypothetical protein BCR33DRAFT_596915 [Rhizoclosmatium globosum]|eukprot:ORY28415.1 hypothetical protein BCR33DRAFT_596915 [Rhizoclosmatium globosum]